MDKEFTTEQLNLRVGLDDHRGPFQPLLFCDSVINQTLNFCTQEKYTGSCEKRNLSNSVQGLLWACFPWEI